MVSFPHPLVDAFSQSARASDSPPRSRLARRSFLRWSADLAIEDALHLSLGVLRDGHGPRSAFVE